MVSPINFLHQTMWRQIDVHVQQKLIRSSSTNHAYKSIIDTLLFSPLGGHHSKLQSQLFYKDTAGTHNNTNITTTPLNQGLIYRRVLTENSKEFDMEGPLLCDLFQIKKYILNGVELKIKLWQQENSFCLMWPDSSKKYKIKIVETILRVFYIMFHQELFWGTMKQ